MVTRRGAGSHSNHKSRTRQPISHYVNAPPPPRSFARSRGASVGEREVINTSKQRGTVNRVILGDPQPSMLAASDVPKRGGGLSSSSVSSSSSASDNSKDKNRRVSKEQQQDPVKDQTQKSIRRSGTTGGTWSSLGFIFWLMRQFSPGILMLSCFFIYQNTRRAAILSEALRLAMTAGEKQPSALINAKRADFTTRLGSKVPAALRNLADLSIPYNPKTETPYFWDIHLAGETIAESIFSKCHFLIQACEHGLKQPNYKEDQLEVFQHGNGAVYVNVDTSTEQGIERAAKLNLADSQLANVMISPHLHLFVSSIFTNKSKGRFFALFRHPIHRAISMYHYLPTASWDPMYNASLQHMSLEAYATSPMVEHNWMTRFLVGKPGGALRQKDMIAAKEVLRTKCLVGLFEELEPSMERFQMYFGWNQSPAQSQRCREAVLQRGDERHNHGPVDGQSYAWQALAAANMYDLELYEYARELFVLQGEQIFGIHE